MDINVTLDKQNNHHALTQDSVINDEFENIRIQHGLSLASEILSLAAIRAYDTISQASIR